MLLSGDTQHRQGCCSTIWWPITPGSRASGEAVLVLRDLKFQISVVLELELGISLE